MTATPLRDVAFWLGIDVVAWRQYGTTPETARYALVLRDGREVFIGKVTDVLSQTRFRAAVYAALHRLIPRSHPDKWDAICRILGEMAEVLPAPPDVRKPRKKEGGNRDAAKEKTL